MKKTLAMKKTGKDVQITTTIKKGPVKPTKAVGSKRSSSRNQAPKPSLAAKIQKKTGTKSTVPSTSDNTGKRSVSRDLKKRVVKADAKADNKKAAKNGHAKNGAAGK